MKKLALCLMLASVCAVPPAAASTITSTLTVDNVYSLYLSTNDAVLGSLVGTDPNWPNSETYTAPLTPSVTNYIHVVGTNQGGPGGFLGAFTLSDSAFKFANGTQTLLTGTTGWGQNLTGFGNPYNVPVSEGSLGVGPWGNIAGFGAFTPDWIWYYASQNGGDTSTVFFSSAIDPVRTAVPEPASLTLIGLGLFGVGARARRRIV